MDVSRSGGSSLAVQYRAAEMLTCGIGLSRVMSRPGLAICTGTAASKNGLVTPRIKSGDGRHGFTATPSLSQESTFRAPAINRADAPGTRTDYLSAASNASNANVASQCSPI